MDKEAEYLSAIVCILCGFGAKMSHIHMHCAMYYRERESERANNAAWPGLLCLAFFALLCLALLYEIENGNCTCPGHCTDALHFPSDLWLLFNILHLNY